MKNHTLIDLTKKVDHLNGQITVLKNEVAANTQALGFNTEAVEGITAGLLDLAKQTGDWRDDDVKHHQEESDLNKDKIKKMSELQQAVIDLVTALNKKD